jgi:hypothetical protein
MEPAGAGAVLILVVLQLPTCCIAGPVMKGLMLLHTCVCLQQQQQYAAWTWSQAPSQHELVKLDVFHPVALGQAL